MLGAMIDAERDRLVKSLQWAEARHRLVEYVTRRIRSGQKADVDDIVQEVLAKVQEDRCAGWDENTEPDVVPYLQRRGNGPIANWRAKKRRHGVEIPPDDLHAVDLVPDTAAYLRELVELFVTHIRQFFGEKGLRFIRVACDPRVDQAKELGLTEMEVTRLKRKILEFCHKLREERGIPTGDAMYHRYPPMSDALLAIKSGLQALLPAEVDRWARRQEWQRKWVGLFVFGWVLLIVVSIVGGLLYAGWRLVAFWLSG
jgi:hypothetical protein